MSQRYHSEVKQLIHDIRAAWPRERRFTWRGWVLLGVLGCLMVVVMRGWEPVFALQVFARWIGWDERYLFTVYVLAMSWQVLPVAQLSLFSLPAIILPLGIRRPAPSWWWYVVVIVALASTGAGFITLYRTLRASTPLPISVIDLISRVVVAAMWGALIGLLLRSWLAAVFVPMLTFLVNAGIWMTWSALGGTGALPVLFYGFGWGFSFEPFLFQALLGIGLCLIAFRSWRAPPPAFLCSDCRYDRRGITPEAACPECGAANVSASKPPPESSSNLG